MRISHSVKWAFLLLVVERFSKSSYTFRFPQQEYLIITSQQRPGDLVARLSASSKVVYEVVNQRLWCYLPSSLRQDSIDADEWAQLHWSPTTDGIVGQVSSEWDTVRVDR